MQQSTYAGAPLGVEHFTLAHYSHPLPAELAPAQLRSDFNLASFPNAQEENNLRDGRFIHRFPTGVEGPATARDLYFAINTRDAVASLFFGEDLIQRPAPGEDANRKRFVVDNLCR